MFNFKNLYAGIDINDKHSIQKLINNFNNLYNISVLYFTPTSDIFYYSPNLNYNYYKFIKTIEIWNIILDYNYQSDHKLFKDLNIENKFIVIKRIQIDIIEEPGYLFFIFDNKDNLDYINTFTYLFEKELNHKFYKKKLDNIKYFNNDINNLFYDIVHMKTDNDIDQFLTKLLQLICFHFNMTCGYIIEVRNKNFYPFLTYNDKSISCKYGLYEYQDGTGPWKVLNDLLKTSTTNFVYFHKVPKKYLNFIKTNNYPKTIFISKLNYRNIEIYFGITNNIKHIKLDEIALSRLQIVFHIIYELLCKKKMYKKNVIVEQMLNEKLDEWRGETKEIANSSRNILTKLKNCLKKNKEI